MKRGIGKKLVRFLDIEPKTPAGNRKLLLNSKAVRIFGEIMDINTSMHYPMGMHNFIFIREYKGVLTNLYMNGMPLKKIQEYAGHSSLKQTMEYIRVVNDGDDIQNYLEML